MIAVRVNGREEQVPAAMTIGQLVDSMGRGRAGIAVAVNERLVERSAWDDTPIGDADRIEILCAAAGG